MATLSERDFSFNGELGSADASISKLSEDHFHIQLAPSPYYDGPPRWVNRCQFEIRANARGKRPTFDVSRPESTRYWFNEYALSYSEDTGKTWQPVQWQSGERGLLTDRIEFPELKSDRILVGNQVPMSADRVTRLNAEFAQHPDVTKAIIGHSREGRPIERLTIAAANGCALKERSTHYVANHHPGEGNACWRIVGLVRWLLGDAAVACRRNSVFYILLMASPDSPSHGWSRGNGDGWDMNRCFRSEGADAEAQSVEPFVIQKDFETLMTQPNPVTACWLFHTWGGKVAPFLLGGPEVPSLGGLDAYAEAIRTFDRDCLIDPPGIYSPEKAARMPNNWNTGPFLKYGITCGLVEGSGGIHTQAENEATGWSLGQAIARFYSLDSGNP